MKNNGYSFTLLSESSLGFTKYRGIITCLNEKGRNHVSSGLHLTA